MREAVKRLGRTGIAMLLLAVASAPADAQTPMVAPLSGPDEPKVAPVKGEDGLYHQSWFAVSFLDLREDLADAHAKGKRFAVIFEQNGCIYCTKMHTEVLTLRYINDFVRENFVIVQLDLWGAREVTDFDGAKMSEKKLAERWGVMFTPTIVFYKDGPPPKGIFGPPLEVTRMSLGIGTFTFYDMFAWVRAKVYERDVNFQRFHIARMNEREAAKKSSKSN
ncbi:MAG: thioredoxin fold domain-containing protein [Hyphomicrobiaceae bacterium]|nr:MAG: thioredoxin fold domain-containing protein [Hyphomicrobiaceae bacterium]